MNLAETRQKQALFEDNLEGTDGKISDLNTPEFILNRGVIGESMEALQALQEKGELSDEFRNEVVDIYVFFTSLLNHIHMDDAELEHRTQSIVMKNFIKYRPENFAGRTLQDGLQLSRDNFQK